MRRRPRPGVHPGPPDDLARGNLPLVSVSGPLFRVHRTRHAPLFFGKTGDNRFDDPRGEYGVLYAGATEACAFIETFGEPLDFPFVTRAQIDARKLSEIELLKPLRLVDLCGSNLRRVGADARLFAAHHSVAQRCSRAPHDHPAQPDGVRYPARHDPGALAVALFDRARRSVRAHVARDALGATGNRALLAQLLDTYGLGLV